MAKKPNQKLKLLYIKELLENESDENHPVSTKAIIDYLENQEIQAERKSIYDDIECLRQFGLDIIQVRGKDGGYFIGERDLELHELKILTDAISSSRFLTQKKTGDLITKLARLATKFNRSELKRKIYVLSRLKSSNEQIYLNVDRIQSALQKDKNISFYYTEWEIAKAGREISYHKRRRHNNKLYIGFPIELIWDDQNYYLLAKTDDSESHKTFRVDRMEKITVLQDGDVSQGKTIKSRFDPATYFSSVFDMYDGKKHLCKLEFHESMLPAILDRFGEKIHIEAAGQADWYQTLQTIRISSRFFGWLLAFDGKVKLVSPDDAVNELEKFLRNAMEAIKIE